MKYSDFFSGGLFVIALSIVLVIIYGILSFILMTAWNYVMPYLFNLPTLGIWQSFALMVIFGIFSIATSKNGYHIKK